MSVKWENKTRKENEPPDLNTPLGLIVAYEMHLVDGELEDAFLGEFRDGLHDLEEGGDFRDDRSETHIG